jgi:SAM-dependent methyltransferase
MKPRDFSLFQEASYTNRYLTLQLESQNPVELFSKLAQRLVDELQPETVLEVGCDNGLLVGELRKRGVQAWGIDQSSEAIREAQLEIAPFLKVTDPYDPLPRNYDLIVCLEAVAYLQPVEAERVIQNLCQHTDDVLFSSNPFFQEGVNPSGIQAPAYWAGLFARHDFYHDLDYPAETIAPWCMRFRKTHMTIDETISIYETLVWQSRMAIRASRTLGVETHLELAQRERLLDELRRTTDHELETYRKELADVYSSRTWRLAKSIQSIRLRLIPLGSRREVWITGFLNKFKH